MIEFQYNRNAQYQSYKDAYKYRMGDACDAALANDNPGNLSPAQLADFQSRCRSGRTFQTLQWVFLGAAVVTSGLGAYVLISGVANVLAGLNSVGQADVWFLRQTPKHGRLILNGVTYHIGKPQFFVH